jgi:sugar phosphate isomerase/epimerase
VLIFINAKMSEKQVLYPNFKWTFSTLGCPELTLDECCSLARAHGLASIELRTIENTADLPVLFERNYSTPENLAGKMSHESISIDFLDTSLKLVGNDSETRSDFLKFIPWAEALGAKWLRVFDGGLVSKTLEDEALNQAVDTLSWWTDLRSKNNWNVDIAIETHDSLVFANARSQLAEKVDRPTRFIWDSHHTWKKAGESLEESWSSLRDLAVNVHIKDSVSKPSARHPFTYVQLGEGEFPLANVLDILKADNYGGNVSIEWERQWHPYLPPLETALSRANELAWI